MLELVCLMRVMQKISLESLACKAASACLAVRHALVVGKQCTQAWRHDYTTLPCLRDKEHDDEMWPSRGLGVQPVAVQLLPSCCGFA